MKETNIGVIFPDEGAFPYELVDDGIVTGWLRHHGFQAVCYRSVRTPGRKAATLQACAELADEEQLLRATDELASEGCSTVAWACTSASFFRGLDYTRYQSDMLAKRLKGTATSTSLALLAALDRLGAKSVDVMMAYMPEVSKSLLDFLAEAGIRVGTAKDIQCGPNQRTFELDYNQELRHFVDTLPDHSDPIVIPSTSLNSLFRIEEFEKIAGRPVLTANQVTMWHSLELAGTGVPINGMGQLFRS